MFRDNPSITDRLREAIKPTPVKRRIQFAAYKLRTQTNRLEKTINQMEHRDRILHDKCVKALEVRDTQSATLFANECVQTTVKNELEGKLPEISTGIHDIEDSLENLTTEIGEVVDADGTYVLPSDDSARILKEADLMAEQKMKEKFPEIPQIPIDAHRIR